ncbi:MAG: Wzz/FepE/Etk N-terminal domain-containing protein [Oceanospirillaceae bacterium]|nr:Wzz/FepE/Etk N-terminal domain-containing protein [Oceanospirillaceae bacterium]
MPNSPEQSQAYNDEIDLADLIRALWQGKWLVIGVTLATLALGIAYLVIAPKSYTASLNILALPNSQADVYIELHEAQLIATDKQSLLALFVEDLKTQTQSVNGLGLSIASVTPTQSRLSFSTQAPGQLTQTVEDALELANQNVNQQLELNFSRHSNKLAANNTTAIEALDLERQQAIMLFKAKQDQQIVALTEQAQIARTIDLDVGSFTSYFNIETNYETKTNKEHNTNSFAGTEAAYLKGHVVLEKEIELIQSRKVEDFIPDLARIDFLQAELLKNKEVKRVEMMLAKTPIGTDQFAAAVYNLDTLVYKNNTKTSLILALSIVLGGMLGIFVLLIRNVLIKQD